MTEYTVKQGDALSQIASKHGVTLHALFQHNRETIVAAQKKLWSGKPLYEGRIGKPHWIFAGMQIEIPDRETARGLVRSYKQNSTY